MITIESDGTKATFDDAEDVLLTAAYNKYNREVFDGMLPPDCKVRWAQLIDRSGYRAMNGWLLDNDPAIAPPPYLFVDDRLRCLYSRSTFLVDLVLLHEMCHFRAAIHDKAFVKEMLIALERVSWEPLATRCVPASLAELSAV